MKMPKWQCVFFLFVCACVCNNKCKSQSCVPKRDTHAYVYVHASSAVSASGWAESEWVCVQEREREWEGVAGVVFALTTPTTAGRQAGSVGKCACSVKCFSKLLKIASKRNNNNVKVICAIVLCIVICPHTHIRRHTLTSVTLCQLLLLLLLFLLFLLSMVGCAQWVHRKK